MPLVNVYALGFDWSTRNNWIVTSVNLTTRVIKHLILCKAQVILLFLNGSRHRFGNY